MMNVSAIFVFCGILFAGCSALVSSAQDQWSMTIVTADEKGAGTCDAVNIEVTGSKSVGTTLVDGYGNFDRGAKFQVGAVMVGNDIIYQGQLGFQGIGDVTALKLALVKSPTKSSGHCAGRMGVSELDNWKVNTVTLTNVAADKEYVFKGESWLNNSSPTVTLLDPVSQA